MPAIIIGHNAIFGKPTTTKTKGFPDGKVRLRIRENEFLIARVKGKNGIREFYVKEEGGFLMPSFEKGSNLTIQ